MIDLEELERPLPCPFCKRPPSHRQKPNDGRWLTDCNTVSCIRPSTGLQQTKAKALRLWNTQALIATAREVEGLRAEVARLKASNNALEHAVIKAAAPDYMTEAEREALHDFVQFLRSPEGSEARAALEGAEAPQSPIPLELKPIHFRLLERGANSRYIGLSNNSGVRMGEHAALGQLMRAGLVRFTEDSQPPGPRMPTPCEITDAGRAALEGKGG